jgi:hypothetical protein
MHVQAPRRAHPKTLLDANRRWQSTRQRCLLASHPFDVLNACSGQSYTLLTAHSNSRRDKERVS